MVYMSQFPRCLCSVLTGAVYMYECPAAPVIPVYVMVCGILALLIMGLFALPKLLCPAAPGNTIWTLWILSLVLFVFIWFIFGKSHLRISISLSPLYISELTDGDWNALVH